MTLSMTQRLVTPHSVPVALDTQRAMLQRPAWRMTCRARIRWGLRLKGIGAGGDDGVPGASAGTPILSLAYASELCVATRTACHLRAVGSAGKKEASFLSPIRIIPHRVCDSPAHVWYLILHVCS